MAVQALEPFHPLIRQWFESRFAAPTDAQVQAWPIIARGEHVLVSAPTGSGKTLTAFLSAIDSLVTGRACLRRRARALPVAAQGAEQRCAVESARPTGRAARACSNRRRSRFRPSA